MAVTWKIFYDDGAGGFTTVADGAGGAVDAVVATPEDAPEAGVLGIIYFHSAVGRRALFGEDFYVYRRNLPNADPNQWHDGDETLIYGAIARGDIPTVTLSGDAAAPYEIPGTRDKRISVTLAGLITYARDKRFIVKRGIYVPEQQMERTLIAMHNDPDLPPMTPTRPPRPEWHRQPDPDWLTGPDGDMRSTLQAQGKRLRYTASDIDSGSFEAWASPAGDWSILRVAGGVGHIVAAGDSFG